MTCLRGRIVFCCVNKFLTYKYCLFVAVGTSYQAFTPNLPLLVEKFNSLLHLPNLLRQHLYLARLIFYHFHLTESSEYACNLV